MDISIVVPTFNSAKTLSWTLLSLQSQEDCNVEIIVVDSGSTDKTLEICKTFNVRTIYEPPGNMYRAINTGLKTSTCDWIGYLNSDDIVFPRTYTRLIKLGNKLSAQVVYGSCDFIDRENRFLFSYFPGKPNELLSHCRTSQVGFIQPAAIFGSEVFFNLSGFDDQYSYASDYDFFWRALLNKYAFSQLGGPPVACFRISSTQLSQNKNEVLLQTKLIQQKNGLPDFNDRFNTIVWRSRNIPQYLLRIMRRYLISGNISISRTLDSFDEY